MTMTHSTNPLSAKALGRLSAPAPMIRLNTNNEAVYEEIGVWRVEDVVERIDDDDDDDDDDDEINKNHHHQSILF